MSSAPRDEAFWGQYLRQHSHPLNRGLHYAGTVTALSLLTAAALRRDWRLALAAPVAGYGLAWLGHYAVERNKPATFGDPGQSLLSDLRMLILAVTGRVDAELARHGISRHRQGGVAAPAVLATARALPARAPAMHRSSRSPAPRLRPAAAPRRW